MSILDEPGEDPVIEETEAEVADEPTPDPVPEPTTAEADVEEESDEPEPVPTVPLQALNEARHQNRELKQKFGELERQLEEMKSIKAQVDEWRKAQQQTQEQKEFTTDPLGSLQKEIKSLKEMQESATVAQTQAQQEAQQRQHLERTVAQRVQEFSKEHADYPDALNHLLTNRAEELRIMGASEDQIEQTLEAESLGIASSAVQTGANPAEIVYNLAKMRGYGGKAKKQDKIVSLEKGQKASTTLTNARGGAEDSFSLSDISKMSDEEFDKYWDKEVAGKK